MVGFLVSIGTVKKNRAKPVRRYSVPEFMNFKLFGKTVLVENKRFGFFLGHLRSQ